MIRIVDILRALSDDKAFILFNSIALGEGHDFANLIKKLGISPHQYYSRILRITKAGLVKREKGKYITTALGNVVYDAVSTVGTALDYYWAIKVIESYQSSPAASHSKENVTKLIDTLIDDHKIKKVLTSPLVSGA
jgi:DNA-binding Lrp family transcriptional regulator